MQTKPALTKSQVNKAGRTLRKWIRSDESISEAQFQAALGVLLEYRAVHRLPLTSATMGLRSVVRTENCPIEVSQRLKRVPTIVDKLDREPTMQLANMQDIGGCRAVLNTIDQVRRVQKRLAKNRPPVRLNDYIAEPRASGYRGVHVIVDYRGRQIEVQLRTQVMHEWAFTVERLSGRMNADLKSSSGPDPVLRFLEAVSEAMALEEEGKTVDSSLMQRIDQLRAEAVPFLGLGGHE